MTTYRVLGQPAPRSDAREKVTGSARYTADVPLPGALWGKALRSPLPHARITRIDTSQAQKVPGVHAVLTGADVRGVRYGRRLYDIPVLAEERVRFVGDRVAAVGAVDLDTAAEALSLIQVEYEELPAVFDPLEALRDDAPILHPEVNSYVGLPEPLARVSNAFVRNTWARGDVGQGFAQADLVIEHTYTTPCVHQIYLEPHSCLVWIGPDGRVQVWTSSKAPYPVREQLAAALKLPLERILLHPINIGGDFGGKGSPMDVPLAYFLAQRTGRPVRMVMDYAEEFTAGNPRHASVIRLKTGVKRDGTLIAHQAQVVFNSGAYGGFKPARANLAGASKAGGSYKIPHVHMEELQVYTNTVPGGFFRAPGEPQALFAIESHMDSIARALGLDPLALRLKNLVQDGDETPAGARYQVVRGGETLEAAAEAGGYRTARPPGVGRGIAVGERAAGGGESHAAVTLTAEGSVIVHSSIFEPGTGTYTMVQQVVAEELGLPPERIEVRVWNTDGVPFDSGVGGSRVTRVAGVAAHQAAQGARQALLRLAAELLGWPEERLALQGDQVVRQDTGERRPWAGLLARAGRSITAQGDILDRATSPVTSFTAQVAEVSVDRETGEVKLLRFITAHDVGRVLNPLGHQGQINGGVMQGIGYALSEDLRVEEGRVTATTFGDYKVPTIQDIPDLQTVLLESESGLGPYHTKGIGENPIGPVAAAIANAVEDAVGVRIRELPITAEKVYRALREGHTERR
jgi:CO/xanthine dehydrogenase Mo-binding subunit